MAQEAKSKGKGKAPKNKGGRPFKEIDQIEFEKLCGMQCTKDEICGWFDVTDKTLENWCKRTYTDEDGQPIGFSEVFKRKRARGKISLRRYQFDLAKKNASMAIHLGKQYLGQAENGAIDLTLGMAEDDPLSKALFEEAERMNNNEISEEE